MQNKPFHEIVELLSLANLARNGKAEALTPDEWTVIAGLVVKDYPDLPFETLAKIIEKGVKGEYDSDATTFTPINVKTIYRWIRAHLAAERTKPKDASGVIKKLKNMGLIPVWKKNKPTDD